MAAGAPTSMFGPLDWNGLHTAASIQAWPERSPQYGPRVPPEKEYSTSSFEVGTKVKWHGHVQVPSHPAGKAQRIHAYYHKTGVLAHRTEPEYKGSKGTSSLTEANTEPLYSRPTFQTTAPLVLTRSARESAGIPVPTLRPGDLPITDVPSGAQSYRSRSHRSGAKSDRSHYSKTSAPPASVRSARSQQFDVTAHRDAFGNRMPWDFDRRPMYETAAMDYGKNWDAVPEPAAGKSWSGFMEPTKLVAMLTERERSAAQ